MLSNICKYLHSFDQDQYLHQLNSALFFLLKVRLNVATILREDSLLRKQQAKDVELLKNYEMELRDPTEYFIWQQVTRFM